MYLRIFMIACLTISFSLSCLAKESSHQENSFSCPKNGCELVLYVNSKCPYCHKVTKYLNQQGRTIATKNTSDPAVRAELIRIGGKSQVPCLVINGKAL